MSEQYLTTESFNRIVQQFPLKHSVRGNKKVEGLKNFIESMTVIGYVEDEKSQLVVLDNTELSSDQPVFVILSHIEDFQPSNAKSLINTGYDNIVPFKVALKGDTENQEEPIVTEPEEPISYQVYCDLDGVLVDFNKAYVEYFNGGFKDTVKYIELLDKADKVEGSTNPDEIRSQLGESILDEAPVEFWENMEWLPEGKLLWQRIKKQNPIILSAPTDNVTSFIGKKKWVRKHLGNFQVILDKDKYKYVTNDLKVPSDKKGLDKVLIDDLKENITLWRSKGGIGIWHRSISRTLKELKELGIIK